VMSARLFNRLDGFQNYTLRYRNHGEGARSVPQKDPAYRGFLLRPIRDLVGPENRPVLAVVAQNPAPFR